MNLHKWRIRVEQCNDDRGPRCWWWLLPPSETKAGYCCMSLWTASNMAWHMSHGAVSTQPLLMLPGSVLERVDDHYPTARERIRVTDDGAVMVL